MATNISKYFGFSSPLVSYGIITMIFLYAVVLSFNFFSNLATPIIPITINSVEISNPILAPGDPLLIKFDTTISKDHCDSYAERSITSASNDQTVWATTTPLVHNILSQKGPQSLSTKIPPLAPGNYYYKATVHMICGTDSFTASTKLLQFTIKNNS